MNRALDHTADLDLVREALHKDSRAARRLVRRLDCVPRMLAARNSRLGAPLPPSDLADVVQDTLIVIWRKLPTFEGRASLETWVYRICAYELWNAVRRRRNAPHSLEEAELGPAEAEATPAEYEELYRSLERLPAEERDVVELKHFEDLTFRAIGARLGIPDNTAKTRYYRGLRRLWVWLGPASREEFCGPGPESPPRTESEA